MSSRDFDEFAHDYDQLLKDPIRDRFGGTEQEFFHFRKRDLIRNYLRTTGRPGRNLRYLDVGCGRGELLNLLAADFSYAAGCDPSPEMLAASASGPAEKRLQTDPVRLPFEAQSFDFVTAVCVYHHVPPEARPALTREIARVIRPGGIACIIEHNPYNPVTRAIVRRLPVDRDAVLLKPGETRRLMREAQMVVDQQDFFLFFPAAIYRHIGVLEKVLAKLPMGGQYATFAVCPEIVPLASLVCGGP